MQSAHLTYAGKPLVLYDQTQAATPASGSSFLVSSSTFAHGQFPSEHYGSSSVALVPPPYFKPPEVQTFCLVQDRQAAPQHNSYYNISSTNTCSLQAINSTSGFGLPNLAPYAVATFPGNQIAPPVPVQQTQIFQAGPMGLVFGPPPREKHNATSVPDSPAATKCARNKQSVGGNSKIHSVPRLQKNDWPPPPSCSIVSPSSITVTSGTTTATLSSISVVFDSCKSPQSTSYKSCTSTALKQPDDHNSDASSASFDFTIEAEKMVSALCNTASSNELGKDEVRKAETGFFNGAGDNVANKGSWYADSRLAVDYSPNVVGSCRAVGTQTNPSQSFPRQLPELMRKTAYWGCSEAETILNSAKYQDQRQDWLSNVFSATRTAITKSSTSFPVFSGDKIFMYDLMNALLRITNGWLILDNYLNKQHYPSLSNKYDTELTRCFQDWEESTYELLRNVIQTFLKLDEVVRSNFNATNGLQSGFQEGSFPGDVSLYTNSDFFAPSLTTNLRNHWDKNFLSTANSSQSIQESAYAIHYAPQSSGVQNFCYSNLQQNQKETKPRSKWTVTENLTSASEDTKPVPDVTMAQTETIIGGSKFRGKNSMSSAKGTSQQSLNAEFFNLRNKVMESSSEVGKHWNTSVEPKKKPEFLFATKRTEVMEPVYYTNSSIGVTSMSKASDNTYDISVTPKPCLQGIDPLFRNDASGIESVYLGKSLNGGEITKPIGKLSVDVNCISKSSKRPDRNYPVKPMESGTGSIYSEKATTNQLDMATVPKNKITLLSQIEPSTTLCKEPGGMAANLSAWFASMRTPRSTSSGKAVGHPENRRSDNFRSAHSQELSRSAIDLTMQLQMDPNRQLQTLQNMQSIQSAPWNACNLINNRNNVQQVDEYDSSEDVRVYMKPGSYNVPKKRHQKVSNKRMENQSIGKKPAGSVSRNNSTTTTKLSVPATPIVPPPSVSLENSPRLLRRVNSPLSQDCPHDSTWKAACASAEILLEALHAKEEDTGAIEVKEIPDHMNPKSKCQADGASSYEASEDDSGSTCKLSPSGVQTKESKLNKTNVKTDSWLIRTLNNASIKQRQEPDLDSSESSNSSIHEDEMMTGHSPEKLDISLERSQEPRNEDQVGDLAEGIARATYSETVRRCASSNGSKELCKARAQKTTLPNSCGAGNLTSARKCQRKEGDRSFLVHKLRKSIGKRPMKDVDSVQTEEKSVKAKLPKEDLSRLPMAKGHAKKKDGGTGTYGENGKNKTGDRGWSVWYSSRRRQSLSPMAASKLESIHQIVWQMEEAEMFKYPPSSSVAVRSSAESVCVRQTKS